VPPKSAAGAPRGSSDAAAGPAVANVPGLVASTKLLELAHGLYGLCIGEVEGEPRAVAGIAVPATHIIGLPSEGLTAEVLAAADGPSGWVGPSGGTVAVKIPADRGHLLITTYRLAEQEAVPLEIQLVRVDRPVRRAAPASVPAAAAEARPASQPAPTDRTTREVAVEIVVHMAGLGDRRFAGGDWIGTPGQGRPIEAFSVRPLEGLAASDIEYKGYGSGGRETPWVTGPTLCGTRDRGIALTGLAIRLAPRLQGRFDIVYDGAFAASGVAGPRRNGEPLTPSRADDPLEAVQIRLIERGSD
jgi:hypothetical protein